MHYAILSNSVPGSQSTRQNAFAGLKKTNSLYMFNGGFAALAWFSGKVLYQNCYRRN